MMTTDILTKNATEADLEARLPGAFAKAFPWVPSDALKHQVRFSFHIGRANIEIDGAADAAQGRTDILVQAYGKPLAVFELKRPGLALTSDDEAQGLSYAKVMDPPYPLVVITNGDETRRLATHTGAVWNPETPTEEEFAKVVDAAGRVATGALKEAVTTLMGSTPAVWIQAVRAASMTHIDEMTGDWDEPSRPFVSGFLFPRKASRAAVKALQDGHRFLLVHGAPLIGKSSVLREIFMRTVQSADMAILLVDADEGRGVLQSIADLLTAALSWPVTTQEARHWLRLVSSAGGPALTLAVDGVGPSHNGVRRELEDLSSPTFGPQLRLIVTADDSVATKLVTDPKGRGSSAIGRRVDARLDVSLLDDEEFGKAAEALLAHRMGFQHGASSALELRVPWVIRAVGAQYVPGPGDPADRIAVLPAQLSLGLLAHTRGRFSDPELRRKFQGIARGVVSDAQDAAMPITLKLEAMATFVVRRQTLDQHLDRTDIDELMKNGYLKPAIHDSGAPVLFVRLPELLASEASPILAVELMAKAASDPFEAARWLVATTSRIPLGDIIAAHAFPDAVHGQQGVPLEVVRALSEMPPHWEPIRAGTKAAIYIEGSMVDVTFEEDGSFTAEVAGKTQRFPADPDEPAGLLGDHHPWMILSHLAGQRMVYGPADTRLDLELLGLVGSCAHVLRRADNFMQGSGVQTHVIPAYGEVVCHAAGIVEPITFSLFKMLSSEGPQQEEWIDRALASHSIGLLARIDIALREIEKLLRPVNAWARATRQDRIKPALEAALMCAVA